MSEMNWLHILVAAIAYFMLGAIWYSALFQKPWLRFQKINPDNADKSGVGAIMATSFVLMFITTIGVAFLVGLFGAHDAFSGAHVGLFSGVMFSAMAISVSYIYVKKPLGLHFIDGGYHVVGQMIAATILAVWH